MEKYHGLADQITGRCPFDERVPAVSNWGIAERSWAFLRAYLLAPLLITVRAPLAIHTLFLWYLLAVVVRIRCINPYFARLLLILNGFYRIPAFKSTKTNRAQQVLTEKYPLLFGNLTTPTDLLIYIYHLSPTYVHVPWYTSKGDLTHRIETPVKAFILLCIYDQHCRSVKEPLSTNPIDFSSTATIDSFKHILNRLEKLREDASILFFPECSPTNGRVVLKPALNLQLFNESCLLNRRAACISVSNTWKYRSVIHPFPDIISSILDLGEPVRRSKLYVIPLAMNTPFTDEKLMEGISLVSNTPCGGTTALNRMLFFKKATEHRQKVAAIHSE
ncbi:Hypothetical protein GLP15_4309 [Giardia lamblia P15]|uniref:Phospholipid/glycerol acyltransferase domain-containing protein n=1 Tax=Giardia intestinalis (strain P15) TaxID=658858 RepID=E1EWW0_GIAIA|nr:Hypothetical protein GLP15_4309 [Giardia lamblia P15]